MKRRVTRLLEQLPTRRRARLEAQGRDMARAFDLERDADRLDALGPIARTACLGALSDRQLEDLVHHGREAFRAEYGVDLDDLSDVQLQQLAHGVSLRTVLGGAYRGDGNQR